MVNANFATPRWYSYTPLAPEDRMPLETTNKGLEYDLKNSRHYIGRTSSQQVDFMRACAAINEGFASGTLWGLNADVQGYLMDKGRATGRQPMSFNMFTAMLARHLGLLSQIEVNARAVGSGYRAKSRREGRMAQAVAMSRGAQAGGDMVRQAYAEMGVGTNENEASELLVEDNIQDPVINAINNIMAYGAEVVDLKNIRKHIGQSLSMSGLGAVHCYFNGSRLCLEALSHDEVIWDPLARRYDMTDSEFVTVTKLKSVAELMELYHGSREDLKRLEAVVKSGYKDDIRINWKEGMPRLFVNYYKDGDWVERGYVEGPNGPELVVINEVNPDTGKPYYTNKDVINPPENRWTREWKGRTDKKFIVKGRYCAFIPREYGPSVPNDITGEMKPQDLVLAHGECDDIEVDPDRNDSVKFPVKMGCWMNVQGQIVSPLTAAQGPQRVMQIISSDLAHRISKAHGRSVVLGARSLAGGKMTVDQAASNLKEGDPIQVDEAITGSVQNAIGIAGEGLDPNIDKEFAILTQLKSVQESVTQLYDHSFGAQGSANELVGVKRLQWQQTSIAQYPFHEAVSSIMRQVYDWLANPARRMMLKNTSLLEDIVGEDGVRWLLSMQDIDTEQVRVTVELAPDAQAVKQAVDEMVLTQLFPTGLLGPVEAAESLGKSSPEEVYAMARQFTRDAMAAQQQAAQQAQTEQAMAALDAREMELMKQETDLYNKSIDAALKSDATNMKGDMPMLSGQAKEMFPEKPQMQ